jgi:hypothetical protein
MIYLLIRVLGCNYLLIRVLRCNYLLLNLEFTVELKTMEESFVHGISLGSVVCLPQNVVSVIDCCGTPFNTVF